ncbi:DEAD/DEAH box helicase [Konateibacter massiliensis]|uniref:DEAD/DEAH box helicase n=1 Tax=Konateibacter massiliensis TaxID=2002841 RepID=UPI001F294C07|nr:DEAD/DEAH box helicase [Konateibacter massiliensis]
MDIFKKYYDGWTDETHEERKSKYKEIGEKVFSFFQDKATAAGFEERDGQWDMACEIVDGVKEKKHVLVEAGVGIGKSFAYIVPILYHHQKYRKPIAIATSTIALQEQFLGDIETIMEMLNYDLEVIIAKGQTHFLCKKRFDDFFTIKYLAENIEQQGIYDTVLKFGYERAD